MAWYDPILQTIIDKHYGDFASILGFMITVASLKLLRKKWIESDIGKNRLKWRGLIERSRTYRIA